MSAVARLPRSDSKRSDDPGFRAGAHWLKVLGWLLVLGAAFGSAYRRPSIALWSLTDTFWAVVFGSLCGLLVLPYLWWQRRTTYEHRTLLAKLAGNSLFVYPRPGLEQHVPVLGAVKLSAGERFGERVAVVVERAGAVDDTHTLDLGDEDLQRVLEFANRVLEMRAGDDPADSAQQP
ncbi:MAG: hypothetical protein KDK91_25195 [Gammaproteobacteria bacterium]|nr:hypothetical protein [Gammaproteobacteria bacterium]